MTHTDTLNTLSALRTALIERTEPTADLAERTLARIALAAAAPPVHEPHSALEVLTTQPFAPAPGTKRRGLVIRLCVQALAACLLFGVSASFTAFVYPAVVHALEEGRLEACQLRLTRLARALEAYRNANPGADPLHGAALRRALIEGGFATAEDFVCPGAGGDLHGVDSFVGAKPGARDDYPVFWDRFGNHPQGFNVVYADARVELLDVNDLQLKPAGR